MRAHLTLTLALLLLCTGAALAQGTPDWMTPSEETICDGQSGAAYGLCNAYCEAMDCDSANAQASASACAKVKDKFTQLTGGVLPCDTCPLPPPGTTCPCVSEIPNFDSWLNAPGSCQEMGTVIFKFGEGTLIGGACSGFPPLGGACGTFSPQLFITPEEGSACFHLIRDSCTPE